jgi:type IV pilus assembly protein PilE
MAACNDRLPAIPRGRLGFTLIELMIVLAIIAIIAAVAYPAYTDQVARGRRADAKSALLENAQWLQRQYSVSNTFAARGDGSAITSATLPVRRSPREGGGLFYNVQFNAGSPSAAAYTLVAVPTGPMANDRCGTFTLNQAGTRGLLNSAAGTAVAQCWDR